MRSEIFAGWSGWRKQKAAARAGRTGFASGSGLLHMVLTVRQACKFLGHLTKGEQSDPRRSRQPFRPDAALRRLLPLVTRGSGAARAECSSTWNPRCAQGWQAVSCVRCCCARCGRFAGSACWPCTHARVPRASQTPLLEAPRSAEKRGRPERACQAPDSDSASSSRSSSPDCHHRRAPSTRPSAVPAASEPLPCYSAGFHQRLQAAAALEQRMSE